jgi:hypothetical protein
LEYEGEGYLGMVGVGRPGQPRSRQAIEIRTARAVDIGDAIEFRFEISPGC